MKKKSIIIISILGIIILVIGIILFTTNSIIQLNKSSLEIIDATFDCTQESEQFYEDDQYIYSFPCTQSTSVYVKFENGNKRLVVDALKEKQVTIEELIKAGLKVHKDKK